MSCKPDLSPSQVDCLDELLDLAIEQLNLHCQASTFEGMARRYTKHKLVEIKQALEDSRLKP